MITRGTLVAAVALALPCAAGAQGAPPARPRIPGISHVALFAADLARSREFYKGYLGFDEPYSLLNADGTVSITWIKINDRQSIELFPAGAAGTKDGDSLYHIALETDDAQGMLAYLSARGVRAPGGRPLPQTAKAGRIGNLNYFTEDPDGHIIEFTQYMRGGWTVQKQGQFMPPGRISRRMSHAGFAVASLEASLRFYRDILGFTEFWRGSSDGKALSWVNLRVPDGDDYLELMLYSAKPDSGRLHILNHLCLEVPDAGAAYAALSSRVLPPGCKPTDPVRTGVNRKRQFNCYDPDGTRVEVMEASTVDGRPAPSSKAPPPAP
jgi:lactoylglutathione lyase